MISDWNKSEKLVKVKMIVKLFLPEQFFFRKKNFELYGDVIIGECSISYFIIADGSQQFRKLGKVTQLGRGPAHSDDSISFSYDDENPHIYLSYLNIKIKTEQSCNIILYDPTKVSFLHSTSVNYLEEEYNDINMLRFLLNKQDTSMQSKKCSTESILQKAYSIINNTGINNLLFKLFGRTALYNHFVDWIKCPLACKQKSEKFCKIALDAFLGILVIVWVSHYNQSAEYLLKIFADAITQLRTLLRSLKGNPVGLKLNVQLNNFFLDCFTYHVELWAIFIVIISPLFHHFFFPVVMLGLFGLSFQLAILSDLIVLIILHAHCFYIYAALLYNIEKIGIEAMWKVVLGRRKNVLKDRVVPHDYMNRQLYLTTMFFTTLLFLNPTIIVYYTVFAMVRICAYLVNYFLLKIRRKILNLPVHTFVKWMFGYYYDISHIEIECLDFHKKIYFDISTLIFKLHIKSSFPWKNTFMQMNDSPIFEDNSSTKNIFVGIIKGDMISLT